MRRLASLLLLPLALGLLLLFSPALTPPALGAAVGAALAVGLPPSAQSRRSGARPVNAPPDWKAPAA